MNYWQEVGRRRHLSTLLLCRLIQRIISSDRCAVRHPNLGLTNMGTCDRIFVLKSNSPVSPMHFGDGTSCFSLKGENDWWDMTRRRTGQTGKTVR